MVDFDAAAEVLSALGAATLSEVCDSDSFFTGAGCAGISFEAVLWGMFRMSLYLACLEEKILVSIHETTGA